MTQRYEFDHAGEFLEQLRRLVGEGTPKSNIWVRTPYHLPEVEQLLIGDRPGRMRFFPLAGGLGGFLGGLALTTYTVLSWPIISGGKPIVSWPPFLLIGYLLTILFGSVVSLAGFLLLARLPSPPGLREGEEFSERFIIAVGDWEATWKRPD